MKTMIIGFFVAISSVAYAVSIDFATFDAVEIGDLKTTVADDGITVSHTIEFSGPSLSAFAKLLPKVTDENGDVVDGMRKVNINNSSAKINNPEQTTSIYLTCYTKKEKNTTSCEIEIIKGNIPG